MTRKPVKPDWEMWHAMQATFPPKKRVSLVQISNWSDVANINVAAWKAQIRRNTIRVGF
ncbi:MAG: hypothetical protein ACXV2H_09280 [Actinomycetes bacterium]